MKGHSRLLTRSWTLPAGAVALIAAHATILRYVLPHAALSAAVVSGVVILVVIKHLGLLGSLFALFRRQSRH
jgi:hypothetical protein